MDIDWYFKAQDGVVETNRLEFEREYRWLSEGLKLISDIQMFANGDPQVSSLRIIERDNNLERHKATNVVVNLCNDALGSLINSLRLLLFGAHAHAFALLRVAFESCCYAEFLALHPNRVRDYMELEDLIMSNPDVDLSKELRRRLLQFSEIRKALEKRDKQDRHSFYAYLCNFGSHSSPTRVGLGLSPSGGAVLAAVSRSTVKWSRAKWTRICARNIMAVSKYAFELLPEHYPEWFANTGLEERCNALAKEYQYIISTKVD